MLAASQRPSGLVTKELIRPAGPLSTRGGAVQSPWRKSRSCGGSESSPWPASHPGVSRRPCSTRPGPAAFGARSSTETGSSEVPAPHLAVLAAGDQDRGLSVSGQHHCGDRPIVTSEDGRRPCGRGRGRTRPLPRSQAHTELSEPAAKIRLLIRVEDDDRDRTDAAGEDRRDMWGRSAEVPGPRWPRSGRRRPDTCRRRH